MKTMRTSALAAALLSLAACSDLATGAPDGAVAPPPGGGRVTATFRCVQDTRAGTSECRPLSPALPPGVRAFILAGSDIHIYAFGTSYNSSTQVETHQRAVGNDFVQAIGTMDGSTVSGFKVFVISDPVVTAGTGIVDVRNEDGVGIFTAAGQAYWNIGELLNPSDISATDTWTFDVPTTVLAWQYDVAVDAPIPLPNGWSDLTSSGISGQDLVVSETNQWSATQFNARGTPVSGVTWTWSSGNTAVATVSSSGLVTAVAVGQTTIHATSSTTGQVASASVRVD